MSSLKQPPIFNPDGGDSYANWKLDVEVWRLFTKEEAKRQGPAVYLSLQGDAREAVRSIPSADLAKEDGYDQVITALDGVFLKDETTRAFCAIKTFIEFRRESGQNFSKFLVEFNTKHRELKKYKVDLDDGILSYFLLASANLSDDHERLVRATASLKFDDMKDKLQKVFGEYDGNDSNSHQAALPIKEECLYTKNYSRGGVRGGRSSSSSGRGYRGNRGSSSQNRGAGAGRGRCYECDSTEHFISDCPRRNGKNPVGHEGSVMRCHECDSTKHFVNECPHRRVESAKMTVHVTLIAGTASKDQSDMLLESLGKGILDTACTKTVAGQSWIDEFVSVLSEDERREVDKSITNSTSVYRFGDGKETKSKQAMIIPMTICGKRRHLSVDVVDNGIPLLISRPTMTEFGMILDTINHYAIVNGRKFKLDFNKAGHYTISVCEWTDEESNVVFHLEKLAEASKSEKSKKALKLHRQFAHASKERLLRLLKNGGCSDGEFLQEVINCCDSCQFCKKHKHPKPKPIVGLPKADRFNQFVSMDLKEVKKGKIWILHIVDHATRYTQAAIINTKKKEIVVDRIARIWLSYFGAPKKFHSDCGGEFANEVFREMNDKFGIETSTTAGEAPFSNGVVERGNAMLYESMMKTIEDTGCNMDTALAWSVSAKNSLQNADGFSPNQLVLGRNGNLPSVLSESPPVLDPVCRSDLIRENLNAMHKARENFIKAESSDRIKRALKYNVRNYSEVDFQPGERVYYKRRMDKGWRGPAKVLGKETNFVLVRHGSSYYRCHPCHLMKMSDHEQGTMIETHQAPTSNVPTSNVPTSSIGQSGRKQVSFDVPEENSSDDESNAGDADATGETVNTDPVTEEQSVDQQPEETVAAEQLIGAGDSVHTDESVADKDSTDGTVTSNESISDVESEPVSESESDTRNEDNYVERLKKADERPIINTDVQYALQDGTITKARIISTQPKKNGKWKNWVNVHVMGKDEPSSVNWNDILWWREQNKSENILVLNSVEEYNQDIIDAKENELQNLIKHDVFEWIDDEGQSTVSSKWIFHDKINDDGSKWVKGRLVARGFEERLVDKKLDSPTCSRQGLRLEFVSASTMNWELHSLDISSAFLQGNQLERPVFIKPPADICEEGKIWRLKRCIYGLNDAPREWYDRVCTEMKNLGGRISLYDRSVFMWHNEEGLEGVITTHVDDFEYCGTSAWHKRVVDKLCELFQISKKSKGAFKYIGLNINQNGDEIFVDQQTYIDGLQEIQIDNNRKKQLDDPLTVEEQAQLRSACGQLLWVTSQTRPDAAFHSCWVSNYSKDATVRSLIEVNRVIRKLKADSLKINYPCLGEPNAMKVVVYGDGSHGSLPSGASQGGSVVFLTGNGRCAPISWRSKKLNRVTKSPLASEVSAVADAADNGFLVASIVKELYALKDYPAIELRTDSKSLKEHLDTTKIIQDPRLRVDTARLREMVDIGEVVITWVPTEMMLADCLTKKDASSDLLRQVLARGVLPEDL